MESFEDYSLRVKKEGFSLENINVNDNNSRLMSLASLTFVSLIDNIWSPFCNDASEEK